MGITAAFLTNLVPVVVYLLFGAEWTTGHLPFGFYVAVAACGVSYILNALPVVLEDVLEWVREGEVARWPGWAFLVTVPRTPQMPNCLVS